MKRITVKHGRRTAFAIAVVFAVSGAALSGSVLGWQADTPRKAPPTSYLPV